MFLPRQLSSHPLYASRRFPHPALPVRLAGLALAVAMLPAHGAAGTVKVDVTRQYQTLEGWGTSLSWWANGVGAWPEPQRSQFVEALFAAPPKGLGMTYARYNLGAGDCPSCQTIGFPRAVPGYRARADAPYDWSADAAQRWVALQAFALGASFHEIHANSAPWWMTKSGSSTGNLNGAPNLSERYTGSDSGSFAAYLADVTGHYAQQYGLVFRHVQAFNEPNENWWWYRHKKQEGMGATVADQEAVIQSLAKLLPQASPLSKVVGMDHYNLDHVARDLKAYAPATRDAIVQVNAHTYGGSLRKELNQTAARFGKRLIMSEWGSPDKSGKDISNAITRDMREMKPLAWAIWQPDWPGLIEVDYRKPEFKLNPAYHVMAQYARFIRPGYVFVDIDDEEMVAAHDGQNDTLAIVARNWGDKPVEKTFSLHGFAQLPDKASAFRSSAQESVSRLADLPVANGGFKAVLPPGSVTTFVLGHALYQPAVHSIDDSQFSYAGGECGNAWCKGVSPAASGGSFHWSERPGASFSVAFEGTQARVIGARGPAQGIASFSIDGGAETDVDLYAAHHGDHQLVFVTPTLERGKHVLRVRVSGLKHALGARAAVQADRVDVVP
jgi:O-glycosyl hydrolase